MCFLVIYDVIISKQSSIPRNKRYGQWTPKGYECEEVYFMFIACQVWSVDLFSLSQIHDKGNLACITIFLWSLTKDKVSNTRCQARLNDKRYIYMPLISLSLQF